MYKEEEETEGEEYPKRFLSDAQVREAGRKLKEMEEGGKKKERKEGKPAMSRRRVAELEAVKFPTPQKKERRKGKRKDNTEESKVGKPKLGKKSGGDVFHLFPHAGKEKKAQGFSGFGMPSFFTEKKTKGKKKNTIALLDDIFGRKKAKKGKRGKR